MIIAGAFMTLGGSLVVAVGRAARRGLLTPHARVGIRTPATVASQEAWYTAHEAAGMWITIGGWIITIGGLIILLAQPDGGDAARIALFSALLGAASVLYAAFVGNRAASKFQDSGGEGS